MAVYRYPVIIVRDQAGGYSAIPVDGAAEAGFGKTSGEARDDLKSFLEWVHRHESWRIGPDFHDPQIHSFKINVRPEYRTEQRIYPVDEATTIRVCCVTGKQASGQQIASLPMLNTQFTFHKPEELKELVRRYVLMQLEGLPPDQLARHLPPDQIELADVVVRVPKASPLEDKSKYPETLSRIAEPLGERAVRKQFSRAWERDREVGWLVNKLHAEKANVLIVGESGVGKSTILVEAVLSVEKKLLEESKKEEDLPPRRFWLTMAGRIIAGMKYLGQWEERVETMINELSEIQGVLCVDRLLDLVRTGGVGPGDSIAAFLLPYLTRGELRMIAEVTPSELDACRRLMPGLADVFQILHLKPFDRSQALIAIDRQIDSLKSNLHISVGPGVSDRIVQLYRRFMPYSVFPGQSTLFARELLEKSHRDKVTDVTPEHVIKQFMDRTGLPELFLRDEITLHRDKVLDWFRDQVIDQTDACESAANIVMTFKAGLNDLNRPLGVLLFCGPTGVGKTEMANAIAKYFFGAAASPGKTSQIDSKQIQQRLIRLDMSEYSSYDAAERLLGPPHGEPSTLIRRIRQQPFTVLLLDEIEKASPEIFDMLLGVFDEGRLTDRFGRVTNFRSSVIIMTSNLGADRQRAFGFDAKAMPSYRDEAMAFFRPEFFNRLDSVVTFNPLKPATIKAITLKELNSIANREGISQLQIAIRWSDLLVDHLAKIGFDARYGARPLQRTVEREVVSPLAKWLLERPELRNATIQGDWQNDRITFRKI